MPDESLPQSGDCVFCDPDATKATRLYEGRDFYVIADHAPVADAHILLIPRQHFPHHAALPSEMDDEFHSLKSWLGRFVVEQYGKLTYWENGVFGQSVPHAHLHAISVDMDPSVVEPFGEICHGLDEVRSRHRVSGGKYFTVEHGDLGRYMPPDPEIYGRIIRHIRERNGGIWRYNPAERLLHGKPVVDALMAQWRRHYSQEAQPK
jgi:diadenosine tetraphosphate (Ap4A) HIT family hydrolase